LDQGSKTFKGPDGRAGEWGRITATCARLFRDAHVDATAIELRHGMGWRGYLMSCGRESHVGEISLFLTFRSRIALVAIEGLVIFGI